MRRLLALVGLILVLVAVYEAYVLSNQPLAVISAGKLQVSVYPSGGVLGGLDVVPSRGVVVRLSNGSTYVVKGVGRVPFRVNGAVIYFLFDDEGRFLSLSVAGNASGVGFVRSTEEFNRAVLTYTVAPFVAGLAFTFGSLAIARSERGRRRG